MADKTLRCNRCNKDWLYNLKGLKRHQAEFCKGPIIDHVKEVKTTFINVIQNLNETNKNIKDENKNIKDENNNYIFEIQNLKSELEKIKNELIEKKLEEEKIKKLENEKN